MAKSKKADDVKTVAAVIQEGKATLTCGKHVVNVTAEGGDGVKVFLSEKGSVKAEIPADCAFRGDIVATYADGSAAQVEVVTDILEVRNLKKYFPIEKTLFGKTKTSLKAVDDVSFTLAEGTTIGIVGESGCGKTTLGRTILKLYESDGGSIFFDGNDITHLKKSKMLKYRTAIQLIFQDPYSSLPPRMSVGNIIAEAVRVHKIVPKEEISSYVHEIMQQCGLQRQYYDRYPHEFSGGQRQRICIARALAVKPKLVICDEPVSALDVSIQAQIINLLKDLQRTMGLTYVFISHDLSVVKYISDKIGVMYLGSMVEYGAKEDIFRSPMHPYTHSLISAIPIPDPKLEKHKVLYTYDPSIHDYSEDQPELVDIGHNHFVYGNKKEIEQYKALREKNEPIKTIKVVKPSSDPAKRAKKEEKKETPVSNETILDAPVHDTGSAWYAVLSFFLPLLGLIAFPIFKAKHYYKNYKACKKGTIIGWIVIGAIIVIFGLLLLSTLISC